MGSNWNTDENGNLTTPLKVSDGSGQYIKLPVLTTTERNALTPTNGMIIYNSTTTQFEKYGSGSWTPFSGTSSGNVQFTPEGGIAVKFTNNTGSQINKGTVVQVSDTNDNEIEPIGIDDVYPIGVVYADIPNGSSGLVVISGKAEVLVDAATTPARNWWLGVSATTAGYARSQNSDPGATVLHSREVGHTLAGKHSGNLCWAMIHFN